jgi:hypothetical protein
MKLLFCKKCEDVIRLFSHLRYCKCGETSGKYTNDINAVYWGENAVPIGFANSSLLNAVENQPENHGKGEVFEAFVIPKKCISMHNLSYKQ